MCRRSRSASGLSPSTRRGRIRGHLDLPAFDLRQPLLEREPFRHLPHDLPGPVQVAFELREPDDLRREPAFPALLEDPVLVVDLVEADGDDVGADLVQDVVDVPLVAEDGAVDRLEGLHQLEPRILRRDRLVFEPTRRAVPRDDDPQLVAELPRLTQEIEVTGMEEIEDPRRHYTDHKRHARTMSWPSRNTRFLSRAYAFASSLERARPSSDIISQMVAVGASPAMIMRAVVSSVCPRRSSKSGSAAFSKETWPGERNSSAKAWASYPFSRFTASFAIAASRAIVFARSTSVTPVNVSRWFTAIEKALCRSYLKSSADTASRTGYAGPARRSTSVMKGRPIRAWTSPDMVMQIRPPASLRRFRIPAGVTNSLAIVRSVSASRPSPSYTRTNSPRRREARARSTFTVFPPRGAYIKIIVRTILLVRRASKRSPYFVAVDGVPGCWMPAPSRPWTPDGCGTSSPRFRSNCRPG